MNFKHMPELEWYFGYPLALLLMVLSALLPYLYFRRRGWMSFDTLSASGTFTTLTD